MTSVQAHYAQYLVWARRGMSMSALAAYTRTSRANVSQMVTRMERRGLVSRERSDRDGRGVIVRITAYGAHQFARLLRRLRSVERQLTDRISLRRPHATAWTLRLVAAAPPPPRPRRRRPVWPEARGRAAPPWA